MAFPPPEMMHDGADRIAAGTALSRQVVSTVNPVPTPVTMAPTGPDVGVSVKVPGWPAVTVEVAVAESPAPAFIATL